MHDPALQLGSALEDPVEEERYESGTFEPNAETRHEPPVGLDDPAAQALPDMFERQSVHASGVQR
jgi:hypothetical protein